MKTYAFRLKPGQDLREEIDKFAEECGLEVEMLTTKPEIPGDHRKSLFTPNYMDIHTINNVEPEHKHAANLFCQSKVQRGQASARRA